MPSKSINDNNAKRRGGLELRYSRNSLASSLSISGNASDSLAFQASHKYEARWLVRKFIEKIYQTKQMSIPQRHVLQMFSVQVSQNWVTWLFPGACWTKRVVKRLPRSYQATFLDGSLVAWLHGSETAA